MVSSMVMDFISLEKENTKGIHMKGTSKRINSMVLAIIDNLMALESKGFLLMESQ